MKKIIVSLFLLFNSLNNFASADYREDLYNEINQYRISNGSAPLLPNQALEEGSNIQSEWVRYALKNKISYYDHTVDSSWLLKTHPELNWNLLFATFPDGLPDLLSAFDVARLCGYNGTVIDNAAYLKKYSTVVFAWSTSPHHNYNMLNPNWTRMGISKISIISGKTYVVCYFGE